MKIVKLTATLKNERVIELEKNNDVEYTSFRNEFIKTIKKS